MSEAATKLPVKIEESKTKGQAAATTWRPLENLRREVDRLFEDFDRGSWLSPFRHFDFEPFKSGDVPAVDFVEKDNAYEVTAELPGLDEKSIDVKLVNGGLTIRGEKQEEKEEKKKNYHLKERRFGSFERSFRVPDGVDTDKIDARFNKGVLKVTLPKKPEAQKPAKKIEIKAA